MTESNKSGATDEPIGELARRYLRAVDEHEAKIEKLLAEWAEEYYEPGYLSDDEWRIVKEMLEAGETDGVMTPISLAIYRKAATEEGRAHEFEGEWPAKGENDG